MTDNELKHYGILGQKWGVRRFENEDGTLTPEGKIRYGRLSEEKRKKREELKSARSDYRKSVRNANRSELKYDIRMMNPVSDIPGKHKEKTRKIENKMYSDYKKELIAYDKYKRIKNEYKNIGKGKSFINEKNKLSEVNNKRLDGEYSKDAKYYKRKGEAIIAASGILGTAVAAYGVYNIYKNYGKQFYTENNLSNDLYSAISGGLAVYNAYKSVKQRTADSKLLENSKFKKIKDIPKSKIDYNKKYFNSKEESNASKELRHNINPGYPKTGSNKNCMLCTTAMVMRLKGYDVRANTINDGFEMYKPEDWFKNCSVKKVNRKSSPIDLQRELKSQGNGSYGNLMVSWKKWLGGGGHSILYTVRNGKVEFIDGQANRTYTLEQLFKYVDMNDVSYINLTNAIPKDIVAGLVKSNK